MIYEKVPDEAELEFISAQRIETVGLSLRISNILRRHHINTVGEMLEHGPEQLRCLHGFGNRSMQEVVEFMTERGLEWWMCFIN